MYIKPPKVGKHHNIFRTHDEDRNCGHCKSFLPIKAMSGAGACSNEEVCKRFRNLPIVVTNSDEVCWAFEKEER